MESIGFFSPVTFGEQPKTVSQFLLETVDSYFYLSGKKFQVIPGYIEQGSEGGIFVEQDSDGYFLDNPLPYLFTALKVISYFTVILPVIALIAKAVIRSFFSFHLIDVKKELEEGIEISDETTAKIQRLLVRILHPEDPDPEPEHPDSEIEWISTHTHGKNLVFSFPETPDLVFKYARPNMFARQFDNSDPFDKIIKGREICLANNLDLLTMPHAKSLSVTASGQTCQIIAQERLSFNPDDTAQEELYRTSSQLDESMRQLAIFILKSGYSKVHLGNIPILEDGSSPDAPKHIGLIDIEETLSLYDGIFGTHKGGLISCLASEEQIDLVFDEAKKRKRIFFEGYEGRIRAAKRKRLDEIAADQRLLQFYEDKGIAQNPREHIQIDDLDSLGLGDDLDQEGVYLTHITRFDGEIEWVQRRTTVRQTVLDIIERINESIDDSSDLSSTKGKRSVRINTHMEPFASHATVGLTRFPFVVTQDSIDGWLGPILQVLVDKGHLFSVDPLSDNKMLYLQA